MGSLPMPELERLDGYLEPEEGARLAWLASQVPPGRCIVEVGTWRGKSAVHLAKGSLRGSGVRVHCVDPWDLGPYPDPENLATFRRYVTQFDVGDVIVEHRGWSTDVAAQWDDEPVGLLFIDGLHTRVGVNSDLKAWTPLLCPGAVVAFHDYAPRWRGVMEAVDRWVRQNRVKPTRTHHLVDASLP
jgi:predicted O-methyltransferase YrrM